MVITVIMNMPKCSFRQSPDLGLAAGKVLGLWRAPHPHRGGPCGSAQQERSDPGGQVSQKQGMNGTCRMCRMYHI